MDSKKAGAEQAKKFWRRLPAASATDDDWYSSLQDTAEEFVKLIRRIDEDFEGDPYGRLREIRATRREHHLLIVADRVRREAADGPRLSVEDLRNAAEKIVDRGARVVVAGTGTIEPRTRDEERMLASARVHWHKLIHRAGSRSEFRGGWGEKGGLRGTRVDSGRIGRQRPLLRAQLLREHIRDRLEQLAALSTEICGIPASVVTRQDRLLFRELDLLLERARTAARQNPEAATSPEKTRKRRSRSLAEKRRDASASFGGSQERQDLRS